MANIDLDAARRLVEQLERDLAAAQSGKVDPAVLRAEVEQLRALLAQQTAAPAEVHAGLSGVRDRMHTLGDELFNDAVKSGDYLARIGRLLGLS
jgi:multidrug resistance efflux pump